jgi:hypothetical protein
MKRCELLTAFSLTVGTAEHSIAIALKSYMQVGAAMAKLRLLR